MTNTTTVSRPDPVTLAAAIVGAVIVAGLAVPHDVWASAGSGGSGGTMTAAKNFHTNGLSTLQAVGGVVFSVAAVWGLARATFGGKIGIGLLVTVIAAFGLAVSADPDTVLHTIGSWGTDLFV